MVKTVAVVFLVVAQFTIVPFLGLMGHNKHPQFHITGQTIIYKSN